MSLIIRISYYALEQRVMKKIRTLLYNENVISILLVIISFCVYLTTMCRSVGFTDSGELAAVVAHLGSHIRRDIHFFHCLAVAGS